MALGTLGLGHMAQGLNSKICGYKVKVCTLPKNQALTPKTYLEVHCTSILLTNCSYNPIISRVTVVMGLIFRL